MTPDDLLVRREAAYDRFLAALERVWPNRTDPGYRAVAEDVVQDAHLLSLMEADTPSDAGQSTQLFALLQKRLDRER